MYYAHGLVDKNNIIRTVEDIMCSANDSSHETINDFKESVENKLDDYYTKMETLDHIDSAITDFQNNVIKKSYITTNTIQSRIDAASDATYTHLTTNTVPMLINNAIDDLMDYEIPDQYYNKDEVNDEIESAINEYDSEISINYATKEFVNKTKNDILDECHQSFYTKAYIDEYYYTGSDHNYDITSLTNRIAQLEQRIAALESK